MAAVRLDPPIEHSGVPAHLAIQCDRCLGLMLITDTDPDNDDGIRVARRSLATAIRWDCDHDDDTDTCSTCLGRPVPAGYHRP